MTWTAREKLPARAPADGSQCIAIAVKAGILWWREERECLNCEIHLFEVFGHLSLITYRNLDNRQKQTLQEAGPAG